MRLSRPIHNQMVNFGPGPTGDRMFMLAPKNLAKRPSRRCNVLVSRCRRERVPMDPMGPSFRNLWLRCDLPSNVATVSQRMRLGPTMLDALGFARMSRYMSNSSLQLQEPSHRGLLQCDDVAGSYSDLSAANTAFSGVLFDCFARPTLWNSDCTEGRIAKTPK